MGHAYALFDALAEPPQLHELLPIVRQGLGISEHFRLALYDSEQAVTAPYEVMRELERIMELPIRPHRYALRGEHEYERPRQAANDLAAILSQASLEEPLWRVSGDIVYELEGRLVRWGHERERLGG